MISPLLAVKGLSVGFKIFEGYLKVLNGVELTLGEGERVGLVGETGCGKTTTVKSILRVLPMPPARIADGEIFYRGKDILKMKRREIQILRRSELTAIFQDPLMSLNPVFTIGTQLRDIVKDSLGASGQKLTKKQVTTRCIDALKETGMPDPERIMSNYPIQLSGGMRQRVCIAEALSTTAQLLLADEPTTNLDVTIQDQILRKLDELVEEKNVSVVIITHSLGVVIDLTERLYIMYAGTMVEEGQTEELFARPLHPYSQGLMNSVPKLTGEGVSDGIPGRIPNYLAPPAGCRFEPRCERAMTICQTENPSAFNVGDSHRVTCFLYRS